MRWILIFLFVYLNAANLHFSLYKKEGKPGNTLLVIGGIHGNEPGGYFAPSFLVKFYTIKKGALWIVPNLNFDSIIADKRGIYGDMNRKFAYISKKDKDYKIIQDIKKIILNPKVDLILNLHDGHGFYRDKWLNSIFNPQAWGQAFIIDQEKIETPKFSNLKEIAQEVVSQINNSLAKKYHKFSIKNTETKFKDEQMRLSLTYFAITHNKSAFAIETSKNIRDLALKIFYQLKAIEAFMKVMGIEYKRSFDLNVKEIRRLFNKQEYVVINKKSILPIKHLKKVTNYFPLTSKNISYTSNEPLLAIIKKGKYFYMYYGKFFETKIIPQYFDNTCKVREVKLLVDGKNIKTNIATVVNVKKYFKVLNQNYRVNVIGYVGKRRNEAGEKITYKRLIKKYALDRNNKIFRVEFYKNKQYCGMILVNWE